MRIILSIHRIILSYATQCFNNLNEVNVKIIQHFVYCTVASLQLSRNDYHLNLCT